MKETYPGHSKALIAYCIRAIIISIMILGSAIVLSANAQSQILLKNRTLTQIKSAEITFSFQHIMCSRISPPEMGARLQSIVFKGYDQQTAGLF
jgi:hypothetical protein